MYLLQKLWEKRFEGAFFFIPGDNKHHFFVCPYY